MPIRLPFSRRSEQPAPSPAAVHSDISDSATDSNGKLTTKSSSAVNIHKSKKEEDANTYKLQGKLNRAHVKTRAELILFDYSRQWRHLPSSTAPIAPDD